MVKTESKEEEHIMSIISDIFRSYQESLSQSRDRYNALYQDRVENGQEFYKHFFHNLVIPFQESFSNTTARHFLTRQAERFFGTTKIDFVAIDGTCQKDAFSDFVVFFGGAYGAKGRVSLDGDPPKVKYEKWEMNRDVSMVAWMPIPFAEMADISGGDPVETFMVSDTDKINLSGIHTHLMQLAEIFLAYNVATGSSIDAPKLILLDQSLSGIMAASSHGSQPGIAKAGFWHAGRKLERTDVVIAFAHPFNYELGIPSTKVFRRYTAILAEFHKHNVKQIPVSTLEKALNLSSSELREARKFLVESLKICQFDEATGLLSVGVDCRQSWEYTKSLFQALCTRLFIKKDQLALSYEVLDDNDQTRKRQRWMAPDDIQFLISVGLRALIEACWEKKILLIGVVKDSESKYLTRNYLGVMKHYEFYPELKQQDIGLLPWTDRIYLETIPLYCDEKLNAPWASIEFDSTFMTLSLKQDKNKQPTVMGVQTKIGTEIVAPERLFLRSLSQFFISREKQTPLMGHVVFLDRLAYPAWDKTAISDEPIKSSALGEIRPIFYKDNGVNNIGQTLMMYLLSTLTKNHFPEVIGYPDPLHKADWGAKSVGRRVRGMIESSEIPFRSNPIAKTLRQIRDAKKR